MTFPLRGADGAFRPFLTRVVPLRDSQGRVARWFGTKTDITAQVEHETHLNFVMRELSHRSKNLLAVVQAMARQTMQHSAGFEDFEGRFMGRLHGLARSHDVLVRQDWTGATIRDLVGAQLAPFVREDGASVDIDGENLMLKPDAVQNLGFALFELGTNAVKYGALAAPAGKIDDPLGAGRERRPQACALRLAGERRSAGRPAAAQGFRRHGDRALRRGDVRRPGREPVPAGRLLLDAGDPGRASAERARRPSGRPAAAARGARSRPMRSPPRRGVCLYSGPPGSNEASMRNARRLAIRPALRLLASRARGRDAPTRWRSTISCPLSCTSRPSSIRTAARSSRSAATAKDPASSSTMTASS